MCYYLNVQFRGQKLICSFCGLSYVRSIASTIASSPYSVTYCFLFQFTVSLLLFKVIQLLLTSSSSSSLHFYLPSIFPPITCFRRKFLRQLWPIWSAFLLYIVCSIFLPSLTLCNTSFLTRSVKPISILLHTTFQNFLPRYFCYAFQSVQVSMP